jgi:hypothetical protein
MKNVFTITVSDDEPPLFCAADSPAEAMAEAVERANEMGWRITPQPEIYRDGEFPDLADFSDRYTFVSNPHDPMAGLGGCLFGWHGAEWKQVSEAPRDQVWTLIDNDDLWWISPGVHIVNRLGYLLTREARPGVECDYLYE